MITASHLCFVIAVTCFSYNIPSYVNLFDTPSSEAGGAGSGSYSCTFSAGEVCAWRNVKDEELKPGLDWQIADVKNPTDSNVKMGFQTLTGRTDLPNGRFLSVYQQNPTSSPQRAILRTTIQCQQGPGTLSLKYWATSDAVQLRACVKPTNAPGVEKGSSDPSIICSQPFNRFDSLLQTRTINPVLAGSQGPFDIILEESGFTAADFAVIDDLQYTGQFCGGGGNNGGGGSNDEGQNTIKKCEDLDTNFEQGFIPAGWTGRGAGFRNGQWNYGNARTGNIYAGVRGDDTFSVATNNGAGGPSSSDSLGGYAYVGNEGNVDKSNVYVLQSQQVSLKNGATLLFDLLQRSTRPNFQVCVDNIDRCSFTAPQLVANKRWYRDQKVVIPPGDHSVLFVVRNLEPHMYVAVDNIRFKDCGSGGGSSFKHSFDNFA